MNNLRCNTCDHESHHHGESGCQFTTCSCDEFKAKKEKEEIISKQNTATQNTREKLEKWEINPQAFKKEPSPDIKKESIQDIEISQSEIWDEVEANWVKIDELTENKEYEQVDKELDIILEIKFENISAWIKKGHNYNKLRKYDESIICFKTALILDNKEDKKINKKNYEILNFIAIVHRNKDNHKEAINFCKESLKSNECYAPALSELGYNYRAIGENELAIKEYTKLLNIESTNVDALDELAYNYERLKKWDEAIEFYNKSKEVEGKDFNDVYSDIHLANCYLQKGDLEHAEILINKQKIVEHADVYSFRIRGEIYKKMEKYDEAIKNFENEAAHVSSSRNFIWFELGYCYGETGKLYVSLEHYKKYVELEHLTGLAAQNIGWVLSSLGREEEAIKNYEKGLEENPGHFGILDNKSISHEHLGQYEDAIKCLDTILEDTPDRVDTFYKKCKLLVRVGKIIEAIEGFELIQSKNRDDSFPNAEDILNNIGWSWIQKGENEKGLEYVEEALKINSNDEDFLDSKAKALYNLKRYAESKECYEKIFELNKNENARKWIGICLKEMGMKEEDKNKKQKYYDDTIKIFNLILEENPHHSDSWYYKGIINDFLKKYTDAKKCQLEAIKINPDDSYYWQELADIVNKQENSDQAIIYFNKSLQIQPSEYVHTEIGEIFYNKEEYKKAINHFDQALQIKNNSRALIKKGNALFMISKYEKINSWNGAIACYDEALELGQEDRDAFGNKGNALREMKKYDDAIENLNAAIDLDPQWYWAFQMKFYAYQEMKKYDDAINFSNTILEKFPEQEEDMICNLLVDLYKEMGDEIKVKEYKEKCQKLKDLK